MGGEGVDLSAAVWYVLGVVLVLLLLQLLARPLELLFRLAVSALAGGIALWAVNLVGGLVGFTLGLNPASALLVGVLGLPGLVALGLLRLILG